MQRNQILLLCFFLIAIIIYAFFNNIANQTSIRTSLGASDLPAPRMAESNTRPDDFLTPSEKTSSDSRYKIDLTHFSGRLAGTRSKDQYLRKVPTSKEVSIKPTQLNLINPRPRKRTKRHLDNDNPGKLLEIIHRVKTGVGEEQPNYPANYRYIELEKALKSKTELRSAIRTTERGPSNVPGRTRAILVDPERPDSVWIAASAGGGIWRTTNAGNTWTNQTPELSNLTISCLAQSKSNPQVVYAGSGERALAGDANGDGILKSIDRGLTWTWLPATVNDPIMQNITRIIVHPQDANHLLVAANPDLGEGYTNNAIATFKISKDGGNSWSSSSLKLNPGEVIPQIVVAPDDFNRQYIAVNGRGIFRSSDAGLNWSPTAEPPGGWPSIEFGRIELAIGNQNSKIIYASLNGSNSSTGGNHTLLKSDNAGESWTPLISDNEKIKGSEFNDQGFYNKTLMVHPFDDNQLYLGAVDLFKITPTENLIYPNIVKFRYQNQYNQYDINTGLMELIPNAAADNAAASYEFRFGSGQSQKMSYFQINEDYVSATYLGQKDVPYTVFNKKNGKQVKIAQVGTMSDFNPTSSGYLVLMDQAYDTLPVSLTYQPDLEAPLPENWEYIVTFRSHTREIQGTMYEEAGGPAQIVIDSKRSEAPAKLHQVRYIVESYAEEGGNGWVPTVKGVHPDQHFITAIVDSARKSFKLLVGNDGGVYVSKSAANPGEQDNAFFWAGNTYNTAQFYGADKRKGYDHYVGGTQDNGAWAFFGGPSAQSKQPATAASPYEYLESGDGFEVVWNKVRDRAFIWSSQFNYFLKTNDFSDNEAIEASDGVEDGPFFSRLANVDTDPEKLFTITSRGVAVSKNFGDSWDVFHHMPIDFALPDVDVSRTNPEVVWVADHSTRTDSRAGVAMSKDGGQHFENLQIPFDIGYSTSITADLQNEDVAYLTFAVGKKPKLLRTMDAGLTWHDLSGFSPNSRSTGFPDVAVYCALAMPFNPSIIWVGTEIGIFISEDDGRNWSILPEIPKCPIYNLKVVDDQVIVSTWGRGIWTATIPELNTVLPPSTVLTPQVDQAMPLLAPGQAISRVQVNLRSAYDSTWVWIAGVKERKIAGNNQPLTLQLLVKSTADTVLEQTLQLVSFKAGKEFRGLTQRFSLIPFQTAKYAHTEKFEAIPENKLYREGFHLQKAPGFSGRSLQSLHPYPEAAEFNKKFENFQVIYPLPIIVKPGGRIAYRDVAIVEPGEPGTTFPEEDFYDYVVLEASKDLINWIPLAPGYDASTRPDWLSVFEDESSPDSTLFEQHFVNIEPYFKPGDTIVLRFRLYADYEVSAWGWIIDDLKIQVDETTTALNDLHSNGRMRIYPNPVTDQVHIDLPASISAAMNLHLYNHQGQLLKTIQHWKPGTSVNVSLLPAGVYYLSTDHEGKKIVERFVKK